MKNGFIDCVEEKLAKANTLVGRLTMIVMMIVMH